MKALLINGTQFARNVQKNINEEIEGQKVIWKCAMPYVVAGTVFLGLSEQALLQPADKVAWAVSKLMDAAQILCIAKAAYNVFDHFIIQPANISSREIVKLTPKAEEFEALKKEIIRLKQELDETNRKFNPNYVDPNTAIAHKELITRHHEVNHEVSI